MIEILLFLTCHSINYFHPNFLKQQNFTNKCVDVSYVSHQEVIKSPWIHGENKWFTKSKSWWCCFKSGWLFGYCEWVLIGYEIKFFFTVFLFLHRYFGTRNSRNKKRFQKSRCGRWHLFACLRFPNCLSSSRFLKSHKCWTSHSKSSVCMDQWEPDYYVSMYLVHQWLLWLLDWKDEVL